MRLVRQIGHTSIDNVDTKYLVGHRVKHFTFQPFYRLFTTVTMLFTFVSIHPKYNKPGGICQR